MRTQGTWKRGGLALTALVVAAGCSGGDGADLGMTQSGGATMGDSWTSAAQGSATGDPGGTTDTSQPGSDLTSDADTTSMDATMEAELPGVDGAGLGGTTDEPAMDVASMMDEMAELDPAEVDSTAEMSTDSMQSDLDAMETPAAEDTQALDPSSDASQTETETSDETTADEAAADDASAEDPMVDEAGDGEDVPMTDHCAAVADWDPMWVAWEEEVLLWVNETRAVGYDCDTEGVFEATGPLEMNAQLTCSARLHSLDMYENGYFQHESQDGRTPTDRIIAAGYEPSWSGENIAQGYESPQIVVEGWLDSDGHCSNMLNPNFVDIGVGYYPGDYDPEARFSRNSHYWTQNFGSPGGGGGGFGGGGFGGFGGAN